MALKKAIADWEKLVNQPQYIPSLATIESGDRY
jgi:hypothetical protein